MKMLEEYKKVMGEQDAIALATSYGDKPKVRIVNYICDDREPGVIYFSSFIDSQKNKDFDLNENVSFTTIPNTNPAFIKVEKCKVKRSRFDIKSLADKFINKIPDYKEVIEFGAEALIVFELHFDKALVTLDMNNIEEVNLR